MPDAHQVVHEILRVLDGQIPMEAVRLSDLAKSYKELCDRANARLARCGDYLRKRLYCETLYHAETCPDVLDQVGALDLARIEEWRAICREHALDVPPPLLLQTAMEVNEAYTIVNPMQDVLKQLRVMSLCKAPVRERLRVLRRLAKSDSASLHWEEDIKAFEVARLKETAKEIGAAAKADNTAVLRELQEELSDVQWRTVIPAALLKGIESELRRIQVAAGAGRLYDLMPQLDAKYLEMDYPSARALLDAWERIVQENQLVVPADLEEKIGPIRYWVQQQDEELDRQHRFATLCAQLEQAIEGPGGPTPLKRIYREISDCDQVVPEELQHRYVQALRAREMAEQRGRRFKYVVVGLVVLGFCGGVGLFISHSLRKDRARQWATAIEEVIKRKEYEQAGELFGKLKTQEASLAEWPEFTELRKKLEEGQTSDSELVDQFNASHKELVGMTLDKLPALDEPEILLRQMKGAVDGMAPKTKSSAMGPLAEQDERLATERKRRQELMNKEFVELVDKLTKDLATLGQPSPGTDLTEYRNRLADIGLEIKKLDVLQAGVSPNYHVLGNAPRSACHHLLQAVENVERDQNAKQKEARAYARIGTSLTAPGDLANDLEAFAKEFPASPHTVNFAQSVASKDAWTALHEWRQVVQGWAGDMVPGRAADVSLRQTAVEDFLSHHPSCPINPQIQKYLDYLKAASKGDSSWQEPLQNIQKNDLLQLACVRTKDGRTYYLGKDTGTRKTPTGTAIEMIVSENLDDKPKRKTFREEEGLSPVQPSPQRVMIDTMLDRVNQMRVGEYDVFGLDLAESVRQEKDIDPIWKCILMEQALVVAAKLNPALADEVTGMVGSGLVPQNLKWFDPEDAGASAARSMAEKKLDQLKRVATIRQRVIEERQSMLEPLRLECFGYGVVLQDKGRQLRTPVKPLPAGTRLLALVTTNTNARMVELGVIKGGVPVWVPGADQKVLEGTLVFLLPASKVPAVLTK